MAEKSRSQKTVKNIAFSLSSNLITQLLHFAVQTVFIHVLGSSYNGLDGLFSNILTMLSLADLGIGVAMAHTYYKPLADKNEEKIHVLTSFYAKVYLVIGAVVFFAGMVLMPFLPYIIKDINRLTDLGLNVQFIYFWYVLNSAVSYMCAAHKQTLIVADQKQYVVKRIQMYFAAITSVLQIGFLLTFRGKWYSYYIYIICNIVFQIMRNLYIARKCDKMYPFIKVKTKAKMLKEDITGLVKDVYSLFLYRLCTVILNGTDNIIIAAFMTDGIKSIGSYKNYNLLIGSVNALLMQVFESAMASVGNLVAEIKGLGKDRTAEDNDKAYVTFKALHFANFWIFGMCSVVLWVMLDPFVHFWLKKTDIIFLTPEVIFVMIANFYVYGVQTSTTAFRNAYGLFSQGRYRPVAMAIINIIVSVWLVQDYGLLGVFMGTLVSRVTTVVWFDPYIVHKHGFKRSVIPFIKTYVLRVALLIALGFVTEKLANLMPSDNLAWLFTRGIFATLFVNCVLLAIYYHSNEFKFVAVRVKKLISKMVKRK